jgi:hypothetical protein
MVDRRTLVGGSLVTGLTALVAPGSGEAAAAAPEDDQQTALAVERLRATVERQFDAASVEPWRGVALIRQQQRTWLRSTGKFPDYIEIGIDVWDSVYDWHVRHQAPVTIGRQNDGRYSMVFMFTTLLLRPDQPADFIGLPFDADTRRS